MQKYLISLFILMTSCQWVVTHPQEDMEIAKLIEEATIDAYKYEMGPTIEPKAPLVPTPITP
jgi:hypothetical protein